MNDDSKWQPKNAPDLQQDFTNTSVEPAPKPIATKWELEQLIAERRNPVRNLDYLPDSLRKDEVKKEVHEKREKRISYIEDLFAKHRQKTRNGFNINADDHLRKLPLKGMTDDELKDFYNQYKGKDRDR